MFKGKGGKGKAGKTKVTAPKVAKPKVAKPKVAKPKVTKPKVKQQTPGTLEAKIKAQKKTNMKMKDVIKSIKHKQAVLRGKIKNVATHIKPLVGAKKITQKKAAAPITKKLMV